MGSVKGRQGDGTLGRVASGRLVFHSGLVSLDDPRIIPLREGYDELIERLLRPSAAGLESLAGGRARK
jgi:hypothetical protein